MTSLLSLQPWSGLLCAVRTDRHKVNGNHLSNDGAFIEKRRRGLARFLNALVRHPVLSQEQLVIMFLTVPTVRILPSVSFSSPAPC